jgi:hypothetical protein
MAVDKSITILIEYAQLATTTPDEHPAIRG